MAQVFPPSPTQRILRSSRRNSHLLLSAIRIRIFGNRRRPPERNVIVKHQCAAQGLRWIHNPSGPLFFKTAGFCIGAPRTRHASLALTIFYRQKPLSVSDELGVLELANHRHFTCRACSDRRAFIQCVYVGEYGLRLHLRSR